MRLTEEQKQKICEYIQQSLNGAKLMYFGNMSDKLPLVDLLSSENTIESGQGEIENIVEQIYFDMDTWDI